ncbi:MAG: hypothetical protein ACYCYE_08120 [Clostridia bacterium]
MKIDSSGGPAAGSRPKANTDGITIIPARNAAIKSIVGTTADILGITCSLQANGCTGCGHDKAYGRCPLYQQEKLMP